jgi:hypothetical protein
VTYNDLSSRNVFVKLQRDYYFQMRPIIEKQLGKAGIRLAKVLEEVFGR